MQQTVFLTQREKEVVDLLIQAKVPKEIGAALKLSFRTVECHKYSAYRKMDVHSIAELIVKMRDNPPDVEIVVNSPNMWDRLHRLETRVRLLEENAARPK